VRGAARAESSTLSHQTGPVRHVASLSSQHAASFHHKTESKEKTRSRRQAGRKCRRRDAPTDERNSQKRNAVASLRPIRWAAEAQKLQSDIKDFFLLN